MPSTAAWSSTLATPGSAVEPEVCHVHGLTMTFAVPSSAILFMIVSKPAELPPAGIVVQVPPAPHAGPALAQVPLAVGSPRQKKPLTPGNSQTLIAVSGATA